MESKEVEKFISETLPKVAFKFETTYGVPFDVFCDWVKESSILNLFLVCKKHG